MLKIKLTLLFPTVVLIALMLPVIGKDIVPQSGGAEPQRSTAGLFDSLVLLRDSLEYYRVINNGLGPPVKSFVEFRTALALNDAGGGYCDTKSGQVQADNDAACAQL